jgi:hypothetical protein
MPRYYSKTGNGRCARLEGPLNLGRGNIGALPAVKVYLGKRVMSFTEEEVCAMMRFFAEQRSKSLHQPNPDTLVVTTLVAAPKQGA